MAADQDMIDEISGAGDLKALDALRVRLLGKQGEITAKLKSLGTMDPQTRATEAPKIHELRETVTAAIAGRRTAL
jgi:phenylalanyl-tRNA synthetase alpha chain